MKLPRMSLLFCIFLFLQVSSGQTQISVEEAGKICKKMCPRGAQCQLAFGNCRVCFAGSSRCYNKKIVKGIDAFENKKERNLTGKIGPEKLSSQIDFDYSTYNGQIIVGRGDKKFVLSFSKCSNDCIYVMTSDHKNGSNIKRMARIKRITRNKKITISDFDSTSSIYTIYKSEYAILENSKGYFLFLKILDINDDSRGYDKDKIVLRYKINADRSSIFGFYDLVSSVNRRTNQKVGELSTTTIRCRKAGGIWVFRRGPGGRFEHFCKLPPLKF